MLSELYGRRLKGLVSYFNRCDLAGTQPLSLIEPVLISTLFKEDHGAILDIISSSKAPSVSIETIQHRMLG
jgi:hypothetical protein